MTRQRISLTKFQRAVLELDPNMKAATVKGLKAAALRTQGLVVDEIQNAEPNAAVDRGELAGSVHTRMHSDGATVEVRAPHAVFIDQGTRPHMPPLAPLAEWAMRKFGVNEKQARAIAWGVAKKIEKYGTAPRHFMQKAFERSKPVIQSEIRKALAKL
jgi:hypothetical protein